MITVTNDCLQELIQYCKEHLPNEACGIVVGKIENEHIMISGFKGIRNNAARPNERFMFDPGEWTSVLFQTSQTNEQILGIFHSHPTTAALPSTEDLQTLWYELPTYWIISFETGSVPQIGVFNFTHSQSIVDRSLHVHPLSWHVKQ